MIYLCKPDIYLFSLVQGGLKGPSRLPLVCCLNLCAGMKGALATRLCGSADLYQTNKRKPYHSINFITAHDGFSLHDLVVSITTLKTPSYASYASYL